MGHHISTLVRRGKDGGLPSYRLMRPALLCIQRVHKPPSHSCLHRCVTITILLSFINLAIIALEWLNFQLESDGTGHRQNYQLNREVYR